MSADNFVVVRRFKDGWRWAMGFATYCVENNLSFAEGVKPQNFIHGPFDTIEEASNNANKELGIIEYGILISQCSISGLPEGEAERLERNVRDAGFGTDEIGWVG